MPSSSTTAQKRSASTFVPPVAGPHNKKPRPAPQQRNRSVTPIIPIDPTLSSSQSSTTTTKSTASSKASATSANQKTQWKSLTNADGTQNAEDVIVAWLTEAENYDWYKHLQKAGRQACCEQILTSIKEAGIKCDKTPSHVESKIRGITDAWRDADSEWFSTGNGVTLADIEEDESNMSQAEREENQRKKRTRAVFTANFEKKYPYYQVLAPVMGSRTANRPSTLLETGREDSVSLEVQLGLGHTQDDEIPEDSGPSRNSRGYVGGDDSFGGGDPNHDFEKDADYIRLFSKEAERDVDDYGEPETDDETNTSRLLSLRKSNQLSPTGSNSSRSTNRSSTKAAPRDPALVKDASKRSRKEQPADDFLSPITKMMEVNAAMDAQLLAADKAHKERTSGLEERRVAIAEREYEDKAAERAAKRRQEEVEHEQKLRMAEAEHTAKLKAEQVKEERELLSAKLAMFEKYIGHGLSAADAKQAAGL
ncbi:hypothetical protein HD553DRAFT_343597 [Filobasidium floriforme]|uniref:uncharacterized protein n=1 Tax=Filobasidium floriforme TaxID=5210 RepID=UPI001E8E0923|nr:uncharacterized protein HD553DRAFT_343597 [Filobasidium floriforme]KAH8082210.1 hypothetical protein HD553DRAFT_343597 [Filobasidium floriforme]